MLLPSDSHDPMRHEMRSEYRDDQERWHDTLEPRYALEIRYVAADVAVGARTWSLTRLGARLPSLRRGVGDLLDLVEDDDRDYWHEK